MSNEDQSLKDSVQQLLDEARTVLPGIQALLGFQMIAVFNDGFAKRLDSGEQSLHLLAILLVVLATGLIMTPAAYHRQTMPRAVDDHFLKLSSRLVTTSLAALELGLVADLFVVCRLVTASAAVSGTIAAAVLALLTSLWFVYPQWSRKRRSGGRLLEPGAKQ
jgi:hypothetical protein